MKSGEGAKPGTQALNQTKNSGPGSSALQSASGQSSKKSSQVSVDGIGRGGAMYEDETKLLAAMKLYSTLDDSGLEALELKNKYDSKQSY